MRLSPSSIGWRTGSSTSSLPRTGIPPTHASFAASHEGAKPFDTKRLHYGDQTLWPEHCVQGTPAWRCILTWRSILPSSSCARACIPRSNSYSAFVEADGKTTTGLAALLKARGLKRVFACGLATDFCVAHSALDARREGFETFVIEDACRAIDANNSLAEAWARMNAAEVWRIQSAEILG